MRRIDPLKDFSGALRRIEKPARYMGGEYGSIIKEGSGLFSVAISYPDLYEIAMSNQAIRILYKMLNSLEGVRCERIFAPAPDFEETLRARGIPLYSLETGIPLSEFDVVGFSLGYELTLTNLLAILELGGVPLLCRDRDEQAPVVIAGGPAVTNPVPFGPFVDCVFMGEAEGWAERVFSSLAAMKKRGASRTDLLSSMKSERSIWHRDSSGVTGRAFWSGFSTHAGGAPFPVPNMRTVQDHGTVEIMRGCPNACRFCHATCFYRPVRRKDDAQIEAETRELVLDAGYREITLSSLSSGEFEGIHGVVERLNALYSPLKVSFALPSLHVDSLGLSLLKRISEVRKSGLTFAVETPVPQWQEAIGKSAPIGKTIDILREAKGLGWKAAKFYFMVGLPPSFGEDEATPIIGFLREIRAATGMTINANVACFIPKPHTPFQRAAQLSELSGLEKIMTVRKGLKGDGFKIGYHAPFLSLLEGIVSRGDERAGFLSLFAFKKGARLDAWEEHIKVDVWREAIAEAGWSVEMETCRARGETEALPWDSIRLSMKESGESDTPRRHASVEDPIRPSESSVPRRVLFSFSKKRTAAYISHLDLMTVFERALVRAGCRAVFTEGYNPKPRLEFASPIGLGIESEEEIASVELTEDSPPPGFREAMNEALPHGLSIVDTGSVERTPTGKKPSLMAAYWGAVYRVLVDPGGVGASGIRELVESLPVHDGIEIVDREGGWDVRLPVGSTSKAFLAKIRENAAVSILRLRTLASGSAGEPVSYFELFRSSALT
jgi:radical SAM-linked protein